MQRESSTRRAATAVPLLWAPLALVHPYTLEDLTEAGRSTTWLAVHAAQLALTPLLALAILGLLHGLGGGAASAARVAVVVWAALFSAFDGIAGLATGVLARTGETIAADQLFSHGWVGGDVTVLSVLAHGMWGVMIVATAIALRANGGDRRTTVALYLSTPFVLTHVGPVAAVALISLAVALWTGLRRSRAPVPRVPWTPPGTVPAGAGRD